MFGPVRCNIKVIARSIVLVEISRSLTFDKSFTIFSLIVGPFRENVLVRQSESKDYKLKLPFGKANQQFRDNSAAL